MNRPVKVWVLGDSILKGIQVDPETKRYIVHNEIDIPALERQFGLMVHNSSHFGATVLRGRRLLERILGREQACDAVVMDFGGNDCDFRWEEIAACPEGEHHPNVPLGEFIDLYRDLIRRLRQRGIVPILTTLPPLEPQRFFDWWCRDLDQAAVSRWLGGICNIYAHQEQYSRAVERLAQEERVPLVDIRGAFLEHGHLGDLICEDGTHPNSAGQKVITGAFQSFGEQWAGTLGIRTA